MIEQHINSVSLIIIKHTFNYFNPRFNKITQCLLANPHHMRLLDVSTLLKTTAALSKQNHKIRFSLTLVFDTVPEKTIKFTYLISFLSVHGLRIKCIR